MKYETTTNFVASRATGRFLDEHDSADGRSVSIFDFGDISEILGRPTIK